MSVPAVRRIVVGVDGSAESAAAFRWACREASLRGAEVHAVHVREAKCHSLPSYAVPASEGSAPDGEGLDFLGLRPSFLPDQASGSVAGASGAGAGAGASGAGAVAGASGVQVRTEVVDGLAARVLLDRCADADMLVLGTANHPRGTPRSAGPVIRACLRRALCPVVVISADLDPGARRENAARPADLHAKVPAGV